MAVIAASGEERMVVTKKADGQRAFFRDDVTRNSGKTGKPLAASESMLSESPNSSTSQASSEAISKNNVRYYGILFAVIAAVSYGTNSLFARYLYADGFDVGSVLFVRFFPAVIFLGIMIKLHGEKFRLTFHEFLGSFLCGTLFALAAFFLFLSYTKMDAGIATTLLFVYPVLVAPIMAFGFHERLTKTALACLLLSCGGVVLLCRAASGGSLSPLGIAYGLLAALSYALFLVTMNRLSWIRQLRPMKLTFYVILTGLLFFWIRVDFGLSLQGNFTPFAWLNIAGLSIISTVASIGFTSLALPRLGATGTSILGSLEPLTAVFLGVTVFHDVLTLRAAYGIALILISLAVITLRSR